jgi:hypothetical protein
MADRVWVNAARLSGTTVNSKDAFSNVLPRVLC